MINSIKEVINSNENSKVNINKLQGIASKLEDLEDTERAFKEVEMLLNEYSVVISDRRMEHNGEDMLIQNILKVVHTRRGNSDYLK